MRDKGDYYEYITIYVDNLFVFFKGAMAIIETIRNEYDLKGVRSPEYYLCGDIDMMTNNPSTKDIDAIIEVEFDAKDKYLNI